jgi:hypothetical protein
MKNFIKYTLILSLFVGLFQACEDKYTTSLILDQPVTISDFTVNGVKGVINEKNKTIVVKVPDGTDVTKVSPIIKIAEGAIITPAITSNMDFTAPIEFTLVNGDVYSKYTITVSEEFFIGFLGTAATASSITDDDEKAAADWFFANYDNGKYVSFADIKSGKVDVSKFRVLWWYYDSGRALPTLAEDATVLTALTSFYKNGGNILLNTHACAYFWTMGRLTETFNMAIGDGPGGDNPDVWSIGVNVGGKHDNSTHPIFKGIQLTTDAGGFKFFPAIGSGWKEDHNYAILDIAAHYGYGNGDEAAYKAFTEKNNLKWLGTWDWMHDYWMAGILELNPTSSFKGKGIYIGIGGIEFKQNAQGEKNPSGINIYQSNINKLYKNSLDYLSLKK